MNSQWGLLEFAACLAIITVTLSMSVRSLFAAGPHVRQLNVLAMSLPAKLYMMEYHAEHGEWPAPYQMTDKQLLGDTTILRTEARAGAMDFTFSNREPVLAGQVLTVRAWQSLQAANLPIVWGGAG